MEYKIVKFNTTDGLVKLVNEHIAYGWVPFGGTSIFDGNEHICQAMVKYDNHPFSDNVSDDI